MVVKSLRISLKSSGDGRELGGGAERLQPPRSEGNGHRFTHRGFHPNLSGG